MSSIVKLFWLSIVIWIVVFIVREMFKETYEYEAQFGQDKINPKVKWKFGLFNILHWILCVVTIILFLGQCGERKTQNYDDVPWENEYLPPPHR